MTRLAMGAALLALGWPVARPAVAAPASVAFTVNSFLDEIDDNVNNPLCHTVHGACTLRAAIMQADQSSADATIFVPAGIYTLTITASGNDSDAGTGDLNLTAPMSGDPLIQLAGAGAASTIINANQLDRVLAVDAGRAAAIRGVTLRGGKLTAGFGGGLDNQGELTLENSALSGNSAPFGGGLNNAGTLTLTDSMVSGNLASFGAGIDNNASAILQVLNSTVAGNGADAAGGGIYNNSAVGLTLINSTISGNHAGDGGGIYNGVATFLALINSTLSQNWAVNNGGGLYNSGTANFYNITIAFNWADSDQNSSGAGGGLYAVSSAVNLRNSLVAGNYTGLASVYDDCTGTLNSYRQNAFGAVEGPAFCTINTISGGWIALNTLALLGPLQDNGGPTLTHALLPGSNAIDAGDTVQGCIGPDPNVKLASDQRGVARSLGAWCDLGAFESLPPMAFLPVLMR